MAMNDAAAAAPTMNPVHGGTTAQHAAVDTSPAISPAHQEQPQHGAWATATASTRMTLYLVTSNNPSCARHCQRTAEIAPGCTDHYDGPEVSRMMTAWGITVHA